MGLARPAIACSSRATRDIRDQHHSRRHLRSLRNDAQQLAEFLQQQEPFPNRQSSHSLARIARISRHSNTCAISVTVLANHRLAPAPDRHHPATHCLPQPGSRRLQPFLAGPTRFCRIANKSEAPHPGIFSGPAQRPPLDADEHPARPARRRNNLPRLPLSCPRAKLRHQRRSNHHRHSLRPPPRPATLGRLGPNLAPDWRRSYFHSRSRHLAHSRRQLHPARQLQLIPPSRIPRRLPQPPPFPRPVAQAFLFILRTEGPVPQAATTIKFSTQATCVIPRIS